MVELGLLEGIRAELLSPEAVKAAIAAAHRVLREQVQAPAVDPAKLEQLRMGIENLTEATAGGVLKSSPSVVARLAKAEQELAKLESARPTVKAAQIIPGLADEYRAWVEDLEKTLSSDGIVRGLVTERDIARARAQLKKRLGGQIIVRGTEDEIRFETEVSAEEMALRMASNGSQVFMVAGVGFEPTTFGL